MNFATKIFITITGVAVLACLLITFSIYSVCKKNIEHEFVNRYKSYETIASNTLHSLELTTDTINKNAVLLLSEIEKTKGIPTDKYLAILAQKLGINAFYIIDKTGKFIRSSDLSIDQQKNSLFSYNPEYRLLITGHLKVATTPIIPSYPNDVPAKLTMIPNHNKTLILEAGTHLKYISTMLQNIMHADPNIQSIGLYAPNGYELGSISSKGEFRQGRRAQNQNNLLENNETNLFIFSIKVPASVEKCQECIQKKVSSNDHYFYLLKIHVSLTEILHRISQLKLQAALACILIIFIAIVISKYLSTMLVKRITSINNIADKIITSNNLNLQVPLNKSNDEISTLAKTFNKMVQSLKSNQELLVQHEKVHAISKMAGQVAHDIRSPIAVMEITAHTLSKSIPAIDYETLKSAIQNIRDISNNLLNRYRTMNNSDYDENIKKVPAVIFASEIEHIISQKVYEWQNNPCDITFFCSEDSKLCKINLCPDELKRVISNLLNNSYESLAENRKIELNLCLDSSKLKLSISDTGCGIPPNKLTAALAGESSKHTGKGLGLSNAKEYFEKINGFLELKSTQGAGTIVLITLNYA